LFWTKLLRTGGANRPPRGAIKIDKVLDNRTKPIFVNIALKTIQHNEIGG
jgi:hypothetical protein